MAQQLSQAQVRVLAKISRQERLLATESRTVGALERAGYIQTDPRHLGVRCTAQGIAFLAGRR